MPRFIDDLKTAKYDSRCRDREENLMFSTMEFVDYFVALGDDLSVAQEKVTELSTEVALYLYPYVLGNKLPLIDAINSSTLPFMDDNAKNKLITDLTM